jgi:glycosyltransferase involved in cell wall biosynthesis
MTFPLTAAVSPNISVIITCFNYAQYVGGAIQSALAQSYPNKEVIVVNDGSTDDSLTVIKRHAGAITVVDQANQGSVAAYNNGFAASSGDLVIFLDADDLLAPGALAAVAAAWGPGCSKVQYDLGIIGSNGEDLERRFCNFDGGYDAARVRASFRRTGTYRWPVTAGNAYARWFAEPIFPLQIDHGPDGTLNTVAPVYGDVVTIARVLGFYRIHGANMWTSDGLDQARLPYRIEHRRREIAFMRAHAARRSVPVPADDVLDHELPFLNYRLLALKLGLDYPGRSSDSAGGLLRAARNAVREERLPPKLAAAHLAWFHLLAAVPARATPALIRLRFGRGQALVAARGALARWRNLRTALRGAA